MYIFLIVLSEITVLNTHEKYKWAAEAGIYTLFFIVT